MWALKFKQCIECGTTERQHLGKGLCSLCYQKRIEGQHTHEKVRKGYSSSILNKEYLIQHYTNNKKSLSDIAVDAKCSRQFVLKKIKSTI